MTTRTLSLDDAMENMREAVHRFDALNVEAAEAKQKANRLETELRNAQNAVEKARDELDAALPARPERGQKMPA